MAEEKNLQPQKAAEKTNKPAAKPAKEKIPLGKRISKFFKDYRSELRKVVWSSKEDVAKNTTVVIGAIVVSGVVLVLLDLAFNFGITKLGKLI